MTDLPWKCPKCGSDNLTGIDYEWDEETQEDTPYGHRCDDCGHVVSEHIHADIFHDDWSRPDEPTT